QEEVVSRAPKGMCIQRQHDEEEGLDVSRLLGGFPSAKGGRLVGVLLLAALVLAAAGLTVGEASAAPLRIGVIQLVEHPALDDSHVGFMQALEQAGYTVGEDFVVDYQNA